MKHIVWPMVAVLALSGCISSPKVRPEAVQGSQGAYVVDAARVTDYPRYASGFSCRYGISLARPKDFEPPRAELFGALLKKHWPGVETRQVRLEQLDLYHNAHRLRSGLQRSTAIGFFFGGILIGYPLAYVVHEARFDPSPDSPVGTLFLDQLPGEYTPPGRDSVVGCAGQNAGEYDKIRIPGKVSVIVTRLTFTLDGNRYAFRSALPFNHKELKPAAAQHQALDRTIAGIAQRLQAKPTVATRTPPAADDASVAGARAPAPAAVATAAPGGEPPPPLSMAGVQAGSWQARNIQAFNALRGEPGQRCVASGICYRVLEQGSGPQPGPQSAVTLRYRYTLIDGREIASTLDAAEPRSVALSSHLPGVRAALLEVPAGSRVEVAIPPALAYGARGAGTRIPPHSVLLAELELLAVD